MWGFEFYVGCGVSSVGSLRQLLQFYRSKIDEAFKIMCSQTRARKLPATVADAAGIEQ